MTQQEIDLIKSKIKQADQACEDSINDALQTLYQRLGHLQYTKINIHHKAKQNKKVKVRTTNIIYSGVKYD